MPVKASQPALEFEQLRDGMTGELHRPTGPGATVTAGIPGDRLAAGLVLAERHVRLAFSRPLTNDTKEPVR